MIDLIKRFFKIRIIRYGMVGGIGIPVNLFALFVFKHLMGDAWLPLAEAFAFIVSNIVNFILNQFFTYREQVQGIHGWEWIKRFFKGQLASLSSLLVSYAITMILIYVFHSNDYLANIAGIVLAFLYNFFISNKLVFRPTAGTATTRPVHPAANADVMQLVKAQEVKVTPK